MTMGSSSDVLVRITLGHLCTTLAKELSAAKEAGKVRQLLQVIRHLQQGGRLESTAGEYPKIDVLISRLQDDFDGPLNCSLFRSEEQGLFLCLGEVLLHTIAPSWLACLSLSQKEELFFQYFDKGPIIQLLKLLTGKVRGREAPSRNINNNNDGSSDSVAANGQNLHQKVSQFSRDTAQTILNRVFMEKDGVERLVREIQRDCKNNDNPSDGGAKAKVLKEVATWVSSIPERLLSRGQLEVATVIFSKTLESATDNILTESQEKDNCLTLFLASLTRAFCRRGLASSVAESIHRSLHDQRQTLSGNCKCKMMWDLVVPHVKDVYALEHLFHSILLLESSSGSTSERGFPKTLGVCLGGSLGVSSDLKLVVLERILLKRILPLRYLRFVLLFLSRGMEEVERAQGIGSLSIEEVLYRVSLAWSKEDSLSAFSLGHQACLSVIIIECLQLTNRDELEQDYPVIPEILSGVSLRLASANVSVRYQGMSVAKALSVVLDPAKPLVFDVKADFEQSLLRDLQEATRGLLAEKRDLQGGDEQDGLQDTKYANSGSGAHSSSRTHVADIHDAVSYGTNNCIYDECEALSLSDESSRESDSDDESSLEAYDMSDDEDDLNAKLPRTVGSLVKALRKPDDHENFEFVLKHCEKIISNVDSSVKAYVGDLVRALLYANAPEEFMEIDKKTRVTPMECKLRGLTASLVKVPLEASRILIADFYSVHLGVSQRLLILDALRLSAIELSGLSPDDDETVLLATSSSSSTTLANPSSSAIDDGDNDGNNKGNAAKTRIFAPVSLSRKGTEPVSVKNRFAPLSAEFMLPLLCKYDHKGEGLNMLGRDFVLLGKLLQTAAIFLKCGGATHQAIELAFTLFEFVASTGVLDHKESFVRKCTLQAIYQIVETIPSFLLVGGQGGSPLNFEGLQELLLCGAKYDRDEECRLLFAQVLHDLHERCTELLPKIQI